jgi:hypothetical protein
MALGNLKVYLTAETKRFQQGLNRAKWKMKKFSKSVKNVSLGLGALGAAGFIAANKITSKLDSIGKSAKKLGVTTDFFQKMTFAAERSGASVGNVSAGMKRMARVISDANNKLETAKRPLREIGVNFKELQGLGIEKQFLVISDALKKVQDGSKKAALAQEIFGRAGVELIPMIQDYRALAEEAENLGLIIDEKTISAGERFQDSITNIGKSLTAAFMDSGFVPWLADVAEGFDVLLNRSERLGSAMVKLGRAHAEYSGIGPFKSLKFVETEALSEEELEKERLRVLRRFQARGDKQFDKLAKKASPETLKILETEKKLEEARKRMAAKAEELKKKQKEAGKIEKLRVSLAQKLERLRMRGMNTEQKAVFLAEKRAKLLKQIASESGELKQLELKMKLAGVDEQILGLKEDKPEKMEEKNRFAGAVEKGTIEAYRLEIQRNSKSPENETAKNTKKSVEIQQQILEEQKKNSVAMAVGAVPLPAFPIG